MKRNDYWKNIDRVFRLPRVWSNTELRKFAHLFVGDVVNASAWRDIDKQGGYYRDYFENASSYTITNYKSEARGFQGLEGEIFLDLTKSLPKALEGRFDVVFNHTALEHIFEVHEAFSNLCLMSKDIVILVVPFLQEMHGDYGDYWRFTPTTMGKLFSQNNMKMIYCSFNSHVNASVYLFCIGSKNEKKWQGLIPEKLDLQDPISPSSGFDNLAGCHAIQNSRFLRSRRNTILDRIIRRIKG